MPMSKRYAPAGGAGDDHGRGAAGDGVVNVGSRLGIPR
jgi:hypothetical protein